MNVISTRGGPGIMPAPWRRELGWRRLALAAGVVSTLLYFAMDVVAALLYDGYSYSGQTISELSAIDAPTRALWIPLGVVYSLLVVVFGAGVWASAGQKRQLRIVAILVAAVGILGLIAWPFAPMHQREVLAAGGGTFSDTMHIVLAMVDTIAFMLAIAFGATSFGRQFRLYSIGTVVTVLVFGALTGLASPALAENEPTPWIGVTERISVFGSMLWFAVLGLTLLQQSSPSHMKGG